jgi:hypothetical protein
MHTPQPLHCAGSVDVVLDALYRIILFPKFPLTPALFPKERGLETKDSYSSENGKKKLFHHGLARIYTDWKILPKSR